MSSSDAHVSGALTLRALSADHLRTLLPGRTFTTHLDAGSTADRAFLPRPPTGGLDRHLCQTTCLDLDPFPHWPQDAPDSTTSAVHTVGGDVTSLPFVRSSFDLVTIRMLLHHLDPVQVASAVVEATRVLAADGVIVVEDGERLAESDAAAMNTELGEAGIEPEPQPGIEVNTVTDEFRRLGFSTTVTYAGEATFASPPFVSRRYVSQRFFVVATGDGPVQS